jgi:E3 ubiquitin-protein ligase SIAH1
MKSHESIPTIEGEDTLCSVSGINLSGSRDWGIIRSCFGHHFMVVLMKREIPDGQELFFVIVQLIGSRKDAENFEYTLKLNRKGLPFTWKAKTRSIHEPVSVIITNSKCLVFDTKFAQYFADNSNLSINVRISMVETDILWI